MSFLKLLYNRSCLMGYCYLHVRWHQIGLTRECTPTGPLPTWLRPQPDVAAADHAQRPCLIRVRLGRRAVEQLVPPFSGYEPWKRPLNVAGHLSTLRSLTASCWSCSACAHSRVRAHKYVSSGLAFLGHGSEKTVESWHWQAKGSAPCY